MRVLEYLRLAWRYRADPFYTKYLAGLRVLDVATGAGEFVSKDPVRFVGIDIDHNLVSHCRNKGLNVHCMDALALCFPEESFDAVHAAQFIEHLAPVDAIRFLRAAARTVKVGGIVFLTTPGVNNVWGTFSHIRPYPPSAFIKLLGKPVENYMRGEELELELEGYWGTRFYFRNRAVAMVSCVLDLLLPPRDVIGWTIILRKKKRV
jgi:2-polyprenyl-3-methyl-5-hydroxy-6-metoxy-1,4-benzoquinol methylase